jgi:hypothetical protein
MGGRSSVILLEIDAARIAIFRFERDTPRSIYMDGVAHRSKAAQRTEIKAWNVHFFWPRGNVQPIEATQGALMKLSVDLGSPAL